MCSGWGSMLDTSLAPLGASRKEFIWLMRNPMERIPPRKSRWHRAKARVDKVIAHSYLWLCDLSGPGAEPCLRVLNDPRRSSFPKRVDDDHADPGYSRGRSSVIFRQRAKRAAGRGEALQWYLWRRWQVNFLAHPMSDGSRSMMHASPRSMRWSRKWSPFPTMPCAPEPPKCASNSRTASRLTIFWCLPSPRCARRPSVRSASAITMCSWSAAWCSTMARSPK